MSILHKAAATAALGLFMATNALAANLITNGTFEAPSVGSAYASYAAGSTGIMGWAVDSTPADGVQLLSSANEASFSLPNLSLIHIWKLPEKFLIDWQAPASSDKGNGAIANQLAEIEERTECQPLHPRPGQAVVTGDAGVKLAPRPFPHGDRYKYQPKRSVRI